MKIRKFPTIVSFLMCCVAFFSFISGCDTNDNDSSSSASDSTPQKMLLLSETEKEIVLGDESVLSVYSYAYRDDTFTWTSSDSTIVSVNDGVLTANSVGSATVTATATDGVQGSCLVSVVTDGRVPVLDFDFDYGNSVTLLREQKFNFEGYVRFNGKVYTDGKMSYQSSNPAVGTLDADGTFTATAVGSTEITVSASWRGLDSVLLAKTFFVNVEELFIMQQKTLSAQFIETISAGTVTLDTSEVEGTITSVKVDGESVGESATFACSEVGRHTALVETANTKYTIPFVLADFVINNAAELKGANVTTYASKYIVLADDINYGGEAYAAPTTFKGTFDGYGHTISNIKMTGYGLFGVANGATIKDFALTNVEVAPTSNGAAIANTFMDSTMENVFVSGTATPTSATTTTTMLVGVVGKGAIIENCLVIDQSNLSGGKQCALGLGKGTTTGTFVNTVAVTTGLAVAGNDLKDATTDYYNTGNFEGGVTKVSTLTADTLVRFVNRATDVWTFDAVTNTLYLCGNAVYTLSSVTE